MKTIKISIIGAGSMSFSRLLIKDICLTPNLHGSSVCLMDIDKSRLNDIFDICKSIISELGVDIKLEKTLNRHDALKGADFVINTALVGGGKRLKDGWKIAEKYGLKFGCSVNIMFDEPFWLNFYQIRLMETIAIEMLDICPDAWLLLVANPVITATTLLSRKYPKLKVVGSCHGYSQVDKVAEVLGLNHENITYEIAGVNHFIWATKISYKGEDVFPLIDRWLETEAEKYWEKAYNYWTENKDSFGLYQIPDLHDTMSRKSMDMYKRFHAIPIGDTVCQVGSGWPWWHHTNEEIENSWGLPMRDHWFSYAEHLLKGSEELKALSEDKNARIIDRDHLTMSGEQMIPVIESITYDIPRILILSILNKDECVPGIPKDFQVEIPTMVSQSGIKGIKVDSLPRSVIIHILRDRVSPIEMEIEAYERGSRELLVQLVLMDKWIKSEQDAKAFVDEICSMPYNQEMDGYYKN